MPTARHTSGSPDAWWSLSRSSRRPRVARRPSWISAEPNVFPNGPVTTDSGKTLGFRVGAELGDPLTDNSRRVDAYRFHDAVHMGFLVPYQATFALS